MCRARVVYGSRRAATLVERAVHEATAAQPWQSSFAGEIQSMRQRLEETTGKRNLKRGPGGLVDIEFLVQALQLRHAPSDESVRTPNTLAAIEALSKAGYLDRRDGDALAESYRFLRVAEARLRLMNSASKDDMPEEPAEQAKLARAMGYADFAAVEAAYLRYSTATRQAFERIMAQAAR